MKNVEEIAESLYALIEKERKKEHDAIVGKWQEKYEWLVEEIRWAKRCGQDLIAEMKDNNLTAGTIEAEGYLRCAIALGRVVDQIEESHTDQKDEG